MLDPFFTIDPGITGTGWAYFVPIADSAIDSVSFGNIVPRSTKTEDYIARSSEIVHELRYVVSTICKLTFNWPVFIEEPSYMGGAKQYVGQTAAESGSLVKLVWHYGRIWQALSDRGHKITPIPVNTWKGQLPKNISHNRIKALADKHKLNGMSDSAKDHALDAIGIGFHILGIK